MTGPIPTPFDNDPPRSTPFDNDPAVPSVASRLGARARQVPSNPQDYADAFRIQRERGFPADTVARNIERFRSEEDGSVDWVRFLNEAPATAAFLDDDINFGAAQDDAEPLRGLERLVGRWKKVDAVPFSQRRDDPLTNVPRVAEQVRRGIPQEYYRREALGIELGRLAVTPKGQREPAVQARIDELRAEQQRQIPEAENIVESLVFASSRILPSTLSVGAAAVEGAAVGAGVGAAAGPAGAAMGATVGSVLNAFASAAVLEGGNQTLQLEELDGVDPNLAYAYGMSYGIVSGALELVGLGAVAAPFRGAIRPLLRGATAKALRDVTTRTALLDGAKAWAGAVAGETATEVMQQAASLANEAEFRLASNVLDDTALDVFGPDGVSMERVGKEIAETAIETAMGMVLIGIPGAGSVSVSRMAEARQATARREYLGAVMEGAERSTLRERSPMLFQEVLERQVEATGAPREVFVPVERLREVMAEMDVTPAQFAERVGVEVGAVETAMNVTGADVVIPFPQFVANLSKSDLGTALMDDVRFEVGGLTGREAAEADRTMEQEASALAEEMQAVDVDAVEDEGERFVVEDIRRRLDATGRYTESEREAMVQFAARPFLVMGRRLAETNPNEGPRQLYERQNLRVMAGARAEAVFDTQRALDRARARGANASELAALSLRFDKLTDERVALRAAVEADVQTQDVRDEQGRLKSNLRFVSTDALAMEYVTLRDQLAEAGGQLAMLEEATATAFDSPSVEEANARLEEAGLTDALREADNLAAVQRRMREARGVVRRVERTVPRLEAELDARGVSDPDAYLAERDLSGDASFPFGALGQTREAAERMMAFEAHEMAETLPVAQVAVELNVPRERVEAWLAEPRPEVSRTEMLQAAFLAQMPSGEALPATIDVDGVQRPTTNSNGQPIHPTEEGVRNFWRWFGDSKVVDAEGRPLVVYHGTVDSFNTFSVRRTGQRTGSKYGKGALFFTPDTRVASDYATLAADFEMMHPLDKPNVMPVYLSIKNPAEIDAEGQSWARFIERVPEAQRGKKDGVYFRNVVDHAKIQTANEVGGIDVFVAFKATQVKSALANSGEFGPTANILRQGDTGARPNAFFTIRPETQERIVALLATADRSSFLHEMAHVHFRVLADIADADPRLAADYETARRAIGITAEQDADFAAYLNRRFDPKDARYKAFVAAEEKWARSFESYLMDGKAPSKPLARVFHQFRVWLTDIYRALTLPEVSPELRGVFDRLLATDEELAALRDDPANAPLPFDADLMTPEEFAAYERTVADRDADADAALLKSVMAEESRARREEWAARREVVEAEVRSEVEAEPVERAVRAMRDHETQDIRLDTEAVKATYGLSSVRTLPSGTTRTGTGVTADTVAGQFGFEDGLALVTALQGYEPFAKKVEMLVAERMRAEFPDLLNDSVALADAANEAVHRAEGDNVLIAELKLMGRKMGIAPPSAPAVREAARRIVQGMRVADLREARFQQAERREARASEAAIRSGDMSRAAFHKRRQLLNRVLVREIRYARDHAERIQREARRLQAEPAQVRLGRAGAVYQDAMNELLEAYEFRALSRPEMRRRELERSKIAAWVAEMHREDVDTGRVPIPVEVGEDVLARATVRNYGELSVAALEDVYDAMRQIWHTAVNYGKEQDAARRAAYQAKKDAALASIAEHRELAERTFTVDRSLVEKVQDTVGNAHGTLIKPEMVARILDGDRPNGPFQQAVWQPIADAAAEENRVLPELTDALKEALGRIPKDRIKTFFDQQVVVQGVVGPNAPIKRMRGWDVFYLALNYGNASSRAAVNAATVGGVKPFTDANVRKLLGLLRAEELRAVQAVWEVVSSKWPDISAMHRRMTGVAPKKVTGERLDIRSSDGEDVSLAGGYYPLKYDPRWSSKSASQREADLKQLTEGVSVAASTYTRATTQKGHLIERQKANGRMVWMDSRVLSNHLVNMVHDLTHREPLYEVQRFLTDPEVVEAIEDAVGRGVYRGSFLPWLRRVAGEQAFPANYVERLATRARAGTTVVGMGFRFSTAMIQPLGYFQSLDLLGTKYMLRGLNEYRRYGMNAVRAAEELSPAIRERRESFDREIKDWTRQLIRDGKMTDTQAAFFYFIALADMQVAVPTFWGGYYQWLDQNPTDVRGAINAGDQAVRLSQGAGSAKDLASIAAGGPLMRWWTMFYTNGSTLYGLFYRAQRNVAEGRWGYGRLFGSLAALWFIPAAMEALLIPGRGPDEEDEWDEKAWWWLWQMASYPTQVIPLGRDAVRALEPGSPFGGEIAPPPLRAFEAVLKAAGAVFEQTGDVVTGQDNNAFTRGDLRSFVDAVGYWGKLPTGQAWTTGTYLYDWMMGYEAPQTPVEATRNLLFTRPR